MKALVPFDNGVPREPRAAFWAGCEVITGDGGRVYVVGPHGAAEYPAGTDVREVKIPAHWPPPVEPAEWDAPITDATREEWRRKADKIAEVRGVVNGKAVALAWICDTANDDDPRNTMKVWEAMADQAGLAWPGSGPKAGRIAEVRTQAECWGSP